MLGTQQMMTIVVQQEGNETIEFSKSVLTLREVFSECQRLKQYSYQFANKPNQGKNKDYIYFYAFTILVFP